MEQNNNIDHMNDEQSCTVRGEWIAPKLEAMDIFHTAGGFTNISESDNGVLS